MSIVWIFSDLHYWSQRIKEETKSLQRDNKSNAEPFEAHLVRLILSLRDDEQQKLLSSNWVFEQALPLPDDEQQKLLSSTWVSEQTLPLQRAYVRPLQQAYKHRLQRTNVHPTETHPLVSSVVRVSAVEPPPIQIPDGEDEDEAEFFPILGVKLRK